MALSVEVISWITATDPATAKRMRIRISLWIVLWLLSIKSIIMMKLLKTVRVYFSLIMIVQANPPFAFLQYTIICLQEEEIWTYT